MNVLAGQYQPQYKVNINSSSSSVDSSHTATSGFVQEQINLIARIENALIQKDPNRVRAVRGQILVQAKAIEGFIKRQDPNFKTTCTSPLDTKETQIYCSLYASSQELLKLSPLLDRILSRRGESALVRELPLVTGERQSDPVLAMSPIQTPNLGSKAIPFATQEPILGSAPLPGIITKKLVANYTPPMQGAVTIPQEAITVLETAEVHITQAIKQAITQAQSGQEAKFHNPKQTAVALDRFAYDLDPQEKQTYSKFLALPQTGIFRVLPHSVYHRPLNTLQNRLSKTVAERYPFPSLGEKDGFNLNLTLQVGDKFQVLPQGVDYSFMANLGNIPIEKLDATLKTITPEIATAFLNYQPPKQLNKLQQERRRFATLKHQDSSKLLHSVRAQLNNTYLVRLFQFRLPEAVVSGKRLTPQERIAIDELIKLPSSDTIIAFRPVRQRSDGSYTVLWRLINRKNAPIIEDLETYLKY